MPVIPNENKNKSLRESINEIAEAIAALNARLAALPNDTTAINNTTAKTLLTI